MGQINSIAKGERARFSPPQTPETQQRRKEFLQSLVSAFAINGLIAAFLIFTVFHGQTFPPPNLFKVATQLENEKPSEDSGGAPPEAVPVAQQEASSGAAAPTGSVVTTTAVQDFTFTPKLHTEFSPSLASVDVVAPALGASLQADAFADVERQRTAAIKRFIESSTKGGNQGEAVLALSDDQLRGLISADDFGDGSGMMLLIDISGSMREIGEMIDSYVEKTFPKSSSTEIVGCSFKYLADPVIKEITHTARRGKYTDYVFVCDLQDGEGAVAVERLRKTLLTEKRTIRLHVISFDQHPGEFLNRLIMDTGGAFTRVSRVTALPVP